MDNCEKTGLEMISELRKRSETPLTKMSPQDDNGETSVGMRKTLGLFGGISMIMGVMIGSGIFISPKGVLLGAGSVGMSLILWLLGGAFSLCTALVYAELGTLIPKSSGGYAYLLETYHPIFAFLYSWVGVVILQPSAVAMISMICADYVLVPLFNDGCGSPPTLQSKLLTITVILVLMAINCLSVNAAKNVQIFFTLAKVLALVIIILGGMVKLGQGYTEYLSTGFEGTNTNVGEIAIGFYSSMWAYDGWSMLNLVTEELRNHSRNLPLGICIAIPLVTVLYLLTNISYFTVMSTEDILDSPAVALSWAELVIPKIAWVMPLFVAMSTFGAANGSVFGSSRVLHVAAREKHLMKSLSMIHVNRYTPVLGIVVTGTLGIIMVIPANISNLLNFFSFTSWLFNGLIFTCHIYLRYTRPEAHRPFKCPIILSVISILVAVFLVFAPIIMAPQIEFLLAFLFILAGCFLYLPFVHFKREIPGIERLNAGLQLFFQIVEVDEEYIDRMLKPKKNTEVASEIKEKTSL